MVLLWLFHGFSMIAILSEGERRGFRLQEWIIWNEQIVSVSPIYCLALYERMMMMAEQKWDDNFDGFASRVAHIQR